MSRSLSAPWIESFVLELLQCPDAGVQPPARPNRTVQVIGTINEMHCLLLSDTQHCIHAFLTRECFEEMLGDRLVGDLKYSQVTLCWYCLSTVAQVASQQNFDLIQANKVVVPLALQCTKMSWLGGGDVEITMCNPSAVNNTPRVRGLLGSIGHYELKRRLMVRQFPLQQALPDWGECGW
jgi:hypothetical protein